MFSCKNEVPGLPNTRLELRLDCWNKHVYYMCMFFKPSGTKWVLWHFFVSPGLFFKTLLSLVFSRLERFLLQSASNCCHRGYSEVVVSHMSQWLFHPFLPFLSLAFFSSSHSFQSSLTYVTCLHLCAFGLGAEIDRLSFMMTAACRLWIRDGWLKSGVD